MGCTMDISRKISKIICFHGEIEVILDFTSRNIYFSYDIVEDIKTNSEHILNDTFVNIFLDLQ